MHDIPTVDFGRLHTDRDTLTKEFGDALCQIGFVKVRNLLCAQESIDRVHAQAAEVARWPAAEQLRYEFPDLGREVGITQPGTEQQQGAPAPEWYKWFFQFRRNLADKMLSSGAEIAPLVHAAQDVFAECYTLMREPLSLLGEYMVRVGRGTDPERYLRAFDGDNNSVLRVLRYEPFAGEVAATHKDIGFLTYLPAIEDGLEVQTRQGEWVHIVPDPTCALINSGEMLEYDTNGLVVASSHKVVLSEAKFRKALVLFCHTNGNFLIGEGERAVRAGEWVQQMLAKTYQKDVAATRM
jgi:isopenicillin N synthase-like dioxygenase